MAKSNAERQAAYRARRTTLTAHDIEEQIIAAVDLGRQTERYGLQWPQFPEQLVAEWVVACSEDRELPLLAEWVRLGRLAVFVTRPEDQSQAVARWLREHARWCVA